MTQDPREPQDRDRPTEGPEAREPAGSSPPEMERVPVRRAPRYRAFVTSGVLAGLVVALVCVKIFPPQGSFSTGAVLGYLGATFGLLGGLIGAAVAIALDRPRRG